MPLFRGRNTERKALSTHYLSCWWLSLDEGTRGPSSYAGLLQRLRNFWAISAGIVPDASQASFVALTPFLPSIELIDLQEKEARS